MIEEKQLEIVFNENSSKFLRDIEKIVLKDRISYVDAVIHFCERNNIEIETAASIIKMIPVMKSKIRIDYEELNFLPKSAKLPV
jgi:hypothetical protein